MQRHRIFRTVSHTHKEFHQGERRFERWYVDNQVYFITARCRGRYPAFASEAAKAVFWTDTSTTHDCTVSCRG